MRPCNLTAPSGPQNRRHFASDTEILFLYRYRTGRNPALGDNRCTLPRSLGGAFFAQHGRPGLWAAVRHSAGDALQSGLSIRFVVLCGRPKPRAMSCVVDRLGAGVTARRIGVVGVVIPVSGHGCLIGVTGIRHASSEQNDGRGASQAPTATGHRCQAARTAPSSYAPASWLHWVIVGRSLEMKSRRQNGAATVTVAAKFRFNRAATRGGPSHCRPTLYVRAAVAVPDRCDATRLRRAFPLCSPNGRRQRLRPRAAGRHPRQSAVGAFGLLPCR